MELKESKSSKHFRISIVKSILRMVAAISLISGWLPVAGILFIVAEILGILEEL